MSHWRHRYNVMLLETWTPMGTVRRLTIRRRSGRDRIGWDMLQQIKNEVMGADVYAVEVYPAASDVVNESNTRHLWQVPDGWPQPFNLNRR